MSFIAMSNNFLLVSAKVCLCIGIIKTSIFSIAKNINLILVNSFKYELVHFYYSFITIWYELNRPVAKVG